MRHTGITDLPDSDFAFKNLTNSKVADNFYIDEKNNAYTDPQKIIKLYKLDSNQRKRIIAPLIARDSEYVAHNMPCYLVAKQDKIGDFMPIIFYVTDQDYDALIYALLDNNDKPVSKFILQGGQTGGPIINGTDPIWPQKVSVINGNSISSYILHYHWKAGDSLAIVDSVSYKTIINKTGQINTSRTDSNRYTCAPKDW